jgi:hypothetical protein
VYIDDNMDTQKFTTVTIERKTLDSLKMTNENHRSANALIQDLVQMHNHLKGDSGF